MATEKSVEKKGRRRRPAEEVEETISSEVTVGEGKGRATPGRRSQTVQSEERGNFITRPIFRLLEYIGDVRGELGKVSWPSREDTIRLTRIVIIATIVASLGLGIIGLLFGEFIRLGLNTPLLFAILAAIVFVGVFYWFRRSNSSSAGY